MAPYNQNQYGNYYDPVGSQANQPTGYRYQSTTSSASQYPSTATADYQNGGYQGYGNTYASQGNGANAQETSRPADQAASALSNLSSSNYSQPAATAAPSNSTNYDSSGWTASNYGSYTANTQAPNRTQSNNSPVYATQSSATFGRLSVPEQTQSRPSSNTYAQQAYQNARASATPSAQSYQTAYTQPAQQTQTTQQPQRYASPHQAVQAQQQTQNKQSCRSTAHQASPQLATQSIQQASNRQHSASVEPSPITVNPSQVYDDTAERRRKAQIEAEKRRKWEQEQAARKAEEERFAAETRKLLEEKRKAEEEEAAKKAEQEAAAKKAESERKAAERRKKREEQRQSKTAATALTKMASSGTMDAVASEASPANPEEAEMRAMFQKMREFNAKNPAMLAKLWEEERKTHSSQSPQSAKATPTPAQQQRAGSSAAMAAPPKSTPTQQYRPFQKPPPPPPTPKTAAQSMTTSTQPMASQSGTSLWPPQKKSSLAESAAKWLMSLPENTGKAISKESVLKILETNPSYVQLCDALEGTGLRFERALLARELLKAVPDGLKTSAPQPAKVTSATNGTAAQINESADPPKKKRGRPSKEMLRARDGNADSRPMSNSGTVDYEAPPRFTSLADAAREVNSMGKAPSPLGIHGGPVQPPAASPYFTRPQALDNVSRAASQTQPPEQKPEIKPEEPRRPPADKEEAARKNFGDLVDLTAQDSDDDEPPRKILQTMNGQANGVSVQQPPPQAGFKQFKQPMTFTDFYMPGQRPVQSINPNSGGIHPSGPPPPAQMVAPRPHQQPQPPAPQLVQRPKGPSSEQLQQERIKGKMLVEPIMRDRVARKSRYDSSTIARDVLLATGRHPDMRALNAHLNGLQRLLSTHGGGYETEAGRGDRSDLSTIRWNIIDPDAPPQSAKTAEVAGKRLESAAASGEDQTADADADDEDELASARRTVRHVVDNGDGTQRYVSVHEQLNGKAKPKKPRGRPRSSMPGTHFIPSSQRDGTNTPNQQTSAGGAPQSAPAGGRAAGGSPAGTTSGNAAIGYSAFRNLDENGVKKKGRPVGWRKSIHSREAQGLAPAKPGSNPASRLRQSQGPRDANIIEPTYQVWKCQWEGCPAELHNLETLKKHVVKLHGKPTGDGDYECLWHACEAGSDHIRGKGKGKASDVASFTDIDGWMNHVDKEHLQPVAWKQGDGPRGGMSGRSSATLRCAIRHWY